MTTYDSKAEKENTIPPRTPAHTGRERPLPDPAAILFVALLRNNDTLRRMNNEELNDRARILRALASPARLKIVDELSHGERCICELQPLFAMNKSTLSRHVAQLKSVGIVGERQEGVRRYLRLRTLCVLRMLDCTRRVLQEETRRRIAQERRTTKP